MTDHITLPRSTVERALDAPGCERIKDFYLVGPVQRAAVESFAAALAGAAQAEPVDAKSWVDQNMSGNPALMRAMKNHAEDFTAPQPAQPVAVPEIDYQRLIQDCFKTTKQAQGTKGCMQFAKGDEWFRDQMLNAAPTPPAATVPVLEPLTEDQIWEMRKAAKADPQCEKEHWFVLLVRMVEAAHAAKLAKRGGV